MTSPHSVLSYFWSPLRRLDRLGDIVVTDALPVCLGGILDEFGQQFSVK